MCKIPITCLIFFCRVTTLKFIEGNHRLNIIRFNHTQLIFQPLRSRFLTKVLPLRGSIIGGQIIISLYYNIDVLPVMGHLSKQYGFTPS